MGTIMWSDSLSLNIEELDKQHRKFLEIVNDLLDAMKENKAKTFQSEIIDQLISYAFYHFSKEERYLSKSSYPHIDQHKKEHEAFVDKIIKFKKDYDAHKITLTLEMINFMNNWWINHIKVSDRKYLPYLKKD